MHPQIATLDDVPRITAALEGLPWLAIDTEFHAERHYSPRLYLVQIHLPGGDTWILDPLIDGLLPALAQSLISCPWVLHGGTQDIRILHRTLGGVPAQIVDTQIAAGMVSEGFPTGFVGLLSAWTEHVAAKASTLSDWSRRPLSPEQLGYAAEDVELLPPMIDRLTERVESLGRTHLMYAACAEHRAKALAGEDPVEIWWKVTNGEVKTPEEGAVMLHLLAWREDVGLASDQPSRSILSDGMARTVARMRPTGVGDLHANRRFPRGLIKRHGHDLIEVTRRALHAPVLECPAPMRPYTAPSRRNLFLSLAAQAAGKQHRFAPRLVLPDPIRRRMAAEGPMSREAVAACLGEWRDELLGDVLHDALHGDLRLSIAEEDVTTLR